MTRSTRLALAVAFAALTPVAARAVDLAQIKPHMEVTGEDGKHVGTVDKVQGDQMILTKDDPAAGGVHHQLPVTAVGSVSEKAVMLKSPASVAMSTWLPVGKPGGDKPK